MSNWRSIESAPENTDILCYCERYVSSPCFFVGKYSLVEKSKEVLIETQGSRRLVEDRIVKEREWSMTAGYWADRWMPLPEGPEGVEE